MDGLSSRQERRRRIILAKDGYDLTLEIMHYILKEAEPTQNGLHLGQVGGRIVAEVFIGLLKADPYSYLSVLPSWTPELPSRTSGDFRMVDFLTFARVDPASRHQQNPNFA